MAEVLEYALVVLASSALMLFSVGVYSGLTSAIGPARDEAAFSSVVALADAAIEHGSASARLDFSGSIGCNAGAITLAAAGYSKSSPVPVDCSFPPQVVSGPALLTFEYSGGTLTLRVG